MSAGAHGGSSAGVDLSYSATSDVPEAESSPGDLGPGFDLPRPLVEEMALVEVGKGVEVVLLLIDIFK